MILIVERIFLSPFFEALSNIAYMSVARYPQDDSFKASKKLCDLVHPGIVAIFGPTSAFASNHVQSAAEALHLPFMETRWNYNFQRSAYSIRCRQYLLLIWQDIGEN